MKKLVFKGDLYCNTYDPLDICDPKTLSYINIVKQIQNTLILEEEEFFHYKNVTITIEQDE